MSTNILTPQIHYRTGPILPPIGREGSPRSAVLDICSEYMPFPTQVASIQASDRVEIIQQSTREPIILALTPAPQSVRCTRLVAMHIADRSPPASCGLYTRTRRSYHLAVGAHLAAHRCKRQGYCVRCRSNNSHKGHHRCGSQASGWYKRSICCRMAAASIVLE